jgi:hypothetical protein
MRMSGVERTARWRARNPDYEDRPGVRERLNAAHRRHHAKLRAEIIEAYGGECACCGEDLPVFLTIDHVNGGGNQERRQWGGTSLWRRLRREGFPPGYQVLCWNCNAAKHMLGACPCQERLVRSA